MPRQQDTLARVYYFIPCARSGEAVDDAYAKLCAAGAEYVYGQIVVGERWGGYVLTDDAEAFARNAVAALPGGHTPTWLTRAARAERREREAINHGQAPE